MIIYIYIYIISLDYQILLIFLMSALARMNMDDLGLQSWPCAMDLTDAWRVFYLLAFKEAKGASAVSFF